MKLTMFERLGVSRNVWWGGALAGLLLAAGATAIGDVTPEGRRVRDQQRRESFALFAGPTGVLKGNQLQCGIDNQGNVCTDVFNSPTGGGGFWPTGTSDQYIFNTGLQFAAIMAPGNWPVTSTKADTVAAYIFDARGTQQHSSPLRSIFDSQISSDLANWPPEAFVSDPALFQPVLLGRKTASQQDSWTQYWDGDPARNANRKHPMGVRVTQRSLAWNFPTGNESIIYFLYNFENATADPEFQRLNELAFFGGANMLPDAGIKLQEMYASFSTDMDVSDDATQNFSTAVLPFDMGLSYHGRFPALDFVFPPSLFFPPFFTNAIGIVGVKYLRSPVDPATGQQVGLTLFSNTQNPSSPGAQFIDPFGDEQLWRYLSGFLDPAQGDPPCNTEAETPTSRSVCFVFQQAADTRFYQASGPFDLDPGASATIVVAYLVAATVERLPDGSLSGINANAAAANANPPGFPSFHPGFQSRRGCDVNGNNCTTVLAPSANPVKPIERGAGWFQYTGPPPADGLENPANKLDQFQVKVVPGSLLGKALVAQTIFDNKFLLGFAPDVPAFFLVPGPDNVTIVWQPSPSETAGDPFFAVASDSNSALFNPNYRQFDVEGYRIWRGSSPGNLSLIAQFDFDNTTFSDFTCETVLPGEDVGATAVDQAGNTVPVVGFASGETCPLGSAPLVRKIDNNLQFNNGSEGGVPGGGIFRLNNLSAAASRLDTAVVSNSGALPVLALQDNGVPFVFQDNEVTSNFTFFYAVSAFDVNSEASGPISLRSARVSKSTVPRSNAPNLKLAKFTSSISGDDGVALNPSAPVPSLDSEDGTFSGPFPPTDGLVASFAPLVERLLPAFSLSATIDSIVPVFSRTAGTCPNGNNPFGACWQMFVTTDKDGSLTQTVVESYTPWWSAFGEPGEVTDIPVLAASVPFDPQALQQFGIPSGSGAATVTGRTVEAINMSVSDGPQARRFGLLNGGSRWFDGDPRNGANESTPDPTRLIRVGHLAEVDTVWSPISHTPPDIGQPAPGGQTAFEKQCFNRAIAFLGREADVTFTWGGGTFSEVRDVTHHVDVAFSPKASATWGFLTTDANGNGFLDWQDFNFIDGALQQVQNITGGNCDAAAGTMFNASGTAVPVSLASSPTLMPTSTDGLDQSGIAGLVQTGMGFGLYVDGERFIFEAAQLPPDGTAWTLRSYHGGIRTSGGSEADPSGYSYTLDVAGSGFASSTRPILIPGLTFSFSVANATAADPAATDLTKVHTVPDPYLATSTFDLSPTQKQLMFVNLPPEATIRIYTLTGILVDIIRFSDRTGGGRAVWDLRNRNNLFVASGVYFFHVQTPQGDSYVGKFTVVNFAGSN